MPLGLKRYYEKGDCDHFRFSCFRRGRWIGEDRSEMSGGEEIQIQSGAEEKGEHGAEKPHPSQTAGRMGHPEPKTQILKYSEKAGPPAR